MEYCECCGHSFEFYEVEYISASDEYDDFYIDKYEMSDLRICPYCGEILDLEV